MTNIREGFWVLALGLIACFVFFLALGAFSVTDAVGLTVAAVVLSLMWIAHGIAVSHRHDRDPRLTSERERRGF